MAWIELHQTLPTHRKIKKFKRLLNIKTPQAVGHIVMLWLWSIDNAPDGDLSQVDVEDIAEVCDWPKKSTAVEFVLALQEAGLIDPDMRLHDWDQYAGRLISRRADQQVKDRDRQARYRAEKAQAANADTDTDNSGSDRSAPCDTDENPAVSQPSVTRDSHTPVTPVSRMTQDACHAPVTALSRVTPDACHTPVTPPTVQYTTVPNSTVQDNIPPLPPASGGEGEHAELGVQERQFEEFWTVYPKKQGKGAALKAWKRIKPDKTLFEQIIASVQANISRNEQWRRDAGQYIPNPATWLNQTRWLDEIPDIQTGGINYDTATAPPDPDPLRGFHIAGR